MVPRKMMRGAIRAPPDRDYSAMAMLDGFLDTGPARRTSDLSIKIKLLQQTAGAH
jgi:hypothetical protein